MIVQLKRLEIREIEMSRGEFMLFSKPTPEKFQSVKTKLDAAGIQCVSYYTATIKDDTDLDNAVRFAHLLGSRNITGDATGDILNRIDERLTKEGLTFGIHNHYFKQKFAYESPEDVLRALAGRSKTMGASLDIGHIASCGYDTVDAVRKLAPHLKMVHLKDVAGIRRRSQRAARKRHRADSRSDGRTAQGRLHRTGRHRVRARRTRRRRRPPGSRVRP